MPIVRIRRTPASRAAATNSAAGGSQSERWAWVSTTRLKSRNGSPSTLGPARRAQRLNRKVLRAVCLTLVSRFRARTTIFRLETL